MQVRRSGSRSFFVGRFLLVLLPAVLLVGCFDLSENLRVDPAFGLEQRFAGMSGSGLSPFSCEHGDGDLFPDDDNVSHAELDYRQSGDMLYCDVTIDFKNILDLAPGDVIRKRLPPGPWSRGHAKFMEVRRLANGVLQLRQDFHLGGDPPERSADRSGDTEGAEGLGAIIAEQLVGRRLRVRFSAPHIQSSNGFVDRDRQTVLWSRPMAKLFDPDELHNNILIVEFKLGHRT